ncbi:MAG: 6-phosphogluconolactonase [Maribacter sp.]|nr:6-phosphogluconolactonase [Maribacter sp.]
MKLEIYDSKQEVAQKFAKFLADFINGKEGVHIALSGGSTPKFVFDVLADTYAHRIAWHKVNLYWGDERCVPPNDSESNYKMTTDHLLSKITIPQENIHRIKGENDPAYEARRYAALLEKTLPIFEKRPQFDLVILGMGEDGHTASIFPYALGLWNSNRSCEVAVHPGTGQKRITITGNIINNAQAVVFLVTGADKAQKVTQIVKKLPGYAAYPASLVAPKSGALWWFLDAESAKGITSGRS